MKIAKEGDPLPGGVALTKLGATVLNDLRRRQLLGTRATILERIAMSNWRASSQHTTSYLMKQNEAETQAMFEGKRPVFTLDQIRELVQRQRWEVPLKKEV